MGGLGGSDAGWVGAGGGEVGTQAALGRLAQQADDKGLGWPGVIFDD